MDRCKLENGRVLKSMADLKFDPDTIKRTQGMFQFFTAEELLEGGHLLCSNCFNDEGLRLDARSIGVQTGKACPNCGSVNGSQLTKNAIRKLCYQFFVRGTIKRFEYGGCPLIQANELRIGETEVQSAPWVEADVKLIEQHGTLGLFYYLPRFWMVGGIGPLKQLQIKEEIDGVIDRVLELYPKHLLRSGHPIYRVRVNPAVPFDPAQYDSPPGEFSANNRFDSPDLPILYGSPDLELCIHECRTTVNDDLYVAKLEPVGELKMLNLAVQVIEEGKDEFSSLDLAIHFLFLAGRHTYPVCAHIAKRIHEAGFDGLIYPSYFSDLRNGRIPFDTVYGMTVRHFGDHSVPNVAIFGKPLADGKLRVHSINRVLINSIKYDLSFGPAYLGEDMQDITAEKLRARQLQHIYELFNKPVDDSV